MNEEAFAGSHSAKSISCADVPAPSVWNAANIGKDRAVRIEQLFAHLIPHSYFRINASVCPRED